MGKNDDKDPLFWVGGFDDVKKRFETYYKPEYHSGDKITVYYIDFKALLDQVEWLQSKLETQNDKPAGEE